MERGYHVPKGIFLFNGEHTVRFCLSIFFVSAMLLATSHAHANQWLQINTEQYQLIFPDNVAAEAQRVAAKMDEYLAAHLDELPLDRPLKKTPIILYTDAHIANGNVGLFPYKSRWYNRPAPFARLEWFDALAVHEGRHMVQFNQIYDNTTGRALSYAFGDLGVGLFAGLLVPAWYLEGDAVVSETTLTEGGRGRVASFDLWFRTDLLSNQPYSYDRAMLGTGYDRVPYLSPYVLGYFLTGDIRQQYGSLVYDDILQNLGGLSSFNFDAATRKETEQTLSELYNQMMVRQRANWQQQLDALALTPIDVLSKPTGGHWQSLYPIQLSDEAISVVEVNAESGQHLVTLKNGDLIKVTDLPRSVSAQFYSGSKTRGVSQQGGQYCWIDTTPHPTKLFRERGDLYCWLQETGLKQLTSGDKLTSVTHTDDGFIAHRFTNDRRSLLVQLNSQGSEQSTIELPFHSLAYDFYLANDQLVFMLGHSDKNGLYQLDLPSKTLSLLKPEQNETLRAPVLTENWLIYTSDRTGIDQLMATSLSSGDAFEIATRPFGAYYPIFDAANQRIVFADYTSQGQQLAAIPFSDSDQPEAHWLPVSDLPEPDLFVADLVPNELPRADSTDQYDVAVYRPISDFWHPHSWGLNYTGSALSAFINSDDVLEKLGIGLELGYNFAEEDVFGVASLQYRTDFGPYWLASLANQAETNGGDTDWRLALAQPVALKHGTVSQQWTPIVGLGQTLKPDAENRNRLFGQLDASITKDKAFHALQAPFSFNQSLLADVGADGQNLRVLASSQLGFQTFSAHQALDLGSHLQWLAKDDTVLLLDSPLFSNVATQDLTWQGSADYRLQLGAVGKSLTSAAFWRNTEVQLNARVQSTSIETESAFGVTLKPSLNLLRNASIIADPSLSFYIRPASSDAVFLFGLTIRDF